MSEQVAGSPLAVRRVLPLYLVVFAGFVGYSLMIAIFTPLVLRPDGGMLPRSEHGDAGDRAGRAAGALPTGAVLGRAHDRRLSDRYGRKPTFLCRSPRRLLLRIDSGRGWHPHIRAAAGGVLPCRALQANIAVAQSAVADIAPARSAAGCSATYI